MISDTELNAVAIFLGTLMMSLIVLYHFLAVNASNDTDVDGNRRVSSAGVANVASPIVLKQ
jgi:oligosaccharyl transferase complex subunit OST4